MSKEQIKLGIKLVEQENITAVLRQSVKQFGTGAMLTIPKRHLGKEAVVLILED